MALLGALRLYFFWWHRWSFFQFKFRFVANQTDVIIAYVEHIATTVTIPETETDGQMLRILLVVMINLRYECITVFHAHHVTDFKFKCSCQIVIFLVVFRLELY